MTSSWLVLGIQIFGLHFRMISIIYFLSNQHIGWICKCKALWNSNLELVQLECRIDCKLDLILVTLL